MTIEQKEILHRNAWGEASKREVIGNRIFLDFDFYLTPTTFIIDESDRVTMVVDGHLEGFESYSEY